MIVAGALGHAGTVGDRVGGDRVVRCPGIVESHVQETEGLAIGACLADGVVRDRAVVAGLEAEGDKRVGARHRPEGFVAGDRPGAIGEDDASPCERRVVRDLPREGRAHVQEWQRGVEPAVT